MRTFLSIIMKKIILIVVTIIVCSCGTDQGEARRYDYSVINNSSVSIEIIPYINGIKNSNETIFINDKGLINKIDIDYPPYNGGFRMIFALFPKLSVDKIDIIFNGTKKITYENCSPTNSCNTQPRNIFNDVFNTKLTEVYTITLEDFQNAIDCGGNCN